MHGGAETVIATEKAMLGRVKIPTLAVALTSSYARQKGRYS